MREFLLHNHLMSEEFEWMLHACLGFRKEGIEDTSTNFDDTRIFAVTGARTRKPPSTGVCYATVLSSRFDTKEKLSDEVEIGHSRETRVLNFHDNPEKQTCCDEQRVDSDEI